MCARHVLPLALSSALLFAFPVFVNAQAASHDRQAAQVKPNLQFDMDIQPIFDANCVVCHQAGGSQGGLNLEAGMSYGATVSRASEESKLLRIYPGKPEESYLIHKLEGSHIQVGGRGEQMPLSQPLDQDLINVIRKWIFEGASDS